jgi:CubicO group peptidase (beta-lactamase class C family)
MAANNGASGILRISYRGSVLFESGFGSVACQEEEKVTPDHVFMISSITKEFTQVLGLVLEEEGILSLGDTVSMVLPGFQGAIGPVTMQQLVDHTGGLPDIIRPGLPGSRAVTAPASSMVTTSATGRPAVRPRLAT